MQRAIELARQGEGLTSPNPPVGAVCVAGGKVVGEGFHHRAGGPHAEVYALREAGNRAKRATLYVTLEPCSTQGRTPACTEAILSAGVTTVVAGSIDPNPAHAGRGLHLLEQNGLRVISSVSHEATDELIEPFRVWMTEKRPFTTLKLGTTLDGRIADRRGASRWITGPEARGEVQALRRRVDAILVGRRTVAADDPQLIPRPAYGRKPYRVVLSASGRVPLKARLFSDRSAHRTILLTTTRCPGRTLSLLQRRGVDTVVLPDRRGLISLKMAMRRLAEKGILHVLCEGGGALAASLLAADLVDECRQYLAPSFLGGGAISAVGGKGWLMARRPQWRLISCRSVGQDACIIARPR